MKAFQRLGRDAIRNENGLSSMWHGFSLYTMVADPVAAEFIMKSALEKDDLLNAAKLYIGNGSIFAPVSIWKPRRKVMIQSFAPKNIRRFSTVITKQSSILIQQLDKIAGTGTFSIWKYLTAYTMDTVTEATLGYKLHAQKDSRHPLLEAFNFGLQSASIRICSPWLHSDLVYHSLPIYKKLLGMRDYIWQFIRELIIMAKQKDTMEKENNENEHLPEREFSTFLELLMRYSGEEDGFTETEVIEELSTILIAGNDTSAVASSFVMLMLSRHPEVQLKIWDELRDVFGDSDRSPTIEDLLRLKYLEIVIKETLRLYTPVPVVSRRIDKEINLPTGFKIVPGTGAMINIWAIHRNPRYWGDDAEQFRPERFLEAPLEHPAEIGRAHV